MKLSGHTGSLPTSSPGNSCVAFGIARATVDLFQSFDLRRGEAVRAVGAGALRQRRAQGRTCSGADRRSGRLSVHRARRTFRRWLWSVAEVFPPESRLRPLATGRSRCGASNCRCCRDPERRRPGRRNPRDSAALPAVPGVRRWSSRPNRNSAALRRSKLSITCFERAAVSCTAR